MALLRRRHDAQTANDAIDRLYLAVGEAAHTRKEDIGQADIVDAALQSVGLDPSLRAEAMEDSTTLADVLRSHEEAVALGGFGVPTLVLFSETQTYPEKGTFGPVISAVPEGEDAGDLWDHMTALLQRPEFFELKRSR
jgi:2-hydroxychromene-2-carboxylate isomerase